MHISSSTWFRALPLAVAVCAAAAQAQQQPPFVAAASCQARSAADPPTPATQYSKREVGQRLADSALQRVRSCA